MTTTEPVDAFALRSLVDVYLKAEGHAKVQSAHGLARRMNLVLAALEKLQAAVRRVEGLLCDPYQEPPADGQLVIVGTRGGHQNLPYRERVYQRSDRLEKPHVDGDWYGIEGDAKNYPLTYGALNWLDEPACDRGSVTLEGPYIHAEDITKALAGDA